MGSPKREACRRGKNRTENQGEGHPASDDLPRSTGWKDVKYVLTYPIRSIRSIVVKENQRE